MSYCQFENPLAPIWLRDSRLYSATPAGFVDQFGHYVLSSGTLALPMTTFFEVAKNINGEADFILRALSFRATGTTTFTPAIKINDVGDGNALTQGGFVALRDIAAMQPDNNAGPVWPEVICPKASRFIVQFLCLDAGGAGTCQVDLILWGVNRRRVSG